MALRSFYFIRTLTKALTYYYINHSQRHLLVAIENNRCGSPIVDTPIVENPAIVDNFQKTNFLTASSAQRSCFVVLVLVGVET